MSPEPSADGFGDLGDFPSDDRPDDRDKDRLWWGKLPGASVRDARCSSDEAPVPSVDEDETDDAASSSVVP